MPPRARNAARPNHSDRQTGSPVERPERLLLNSVGDHPPQQVYGQASWKRASELGLPAPPQRNSATPTSPGRLHTEAPQVGQRARGAQLTAVPLADGKYLVNRWRMSGAFEHAKQIEKLWISQIGNNQSRMDQLAAHLLPSVIGT